MFWAQPTIPPSRLNSLVNPMAARALQAMEDRPPSCSDQNVVVAWKLVGDGLDLVMRVQPVGKVQGHNLRLCGAADVQNKGFHPSLIRLDASWTEIRKSSFNGSSLCDALSAPQNNS